MKLNVAAEQTDHIVCIYANAVTFTQETMDVMATARRLKAPLYLEKVVKCAG